jgi:hypothetical protein
MTQQVQYIVDLKGAQEAQRELDKIGKSMDNGAASAVKLGTQLDRVEEHTTRAAGGTRNMGQAALEASRGLEDLQYGIGGVVNNIPSLVMALGGGAGLTAAISLAAVGLNQVYKNFVAIPDAADTATKTAKTYVDDLKTEIIDLGKEIRTLQVGATKVAAEEQSKRIKLAMAEAKSAVDAIGGKDRLENLLTLTGGDAAKLESRFSYMQRSIVERSQKPFVSEEGFKAAIAAQEKFDLEARRMAAMQLVQLEKEDKAAREESAKRRTKSSEDINAEAEVRALIAQQEHQDELIAKNEAAYESMVEKEINALADRDQKISDQASKAFKQQEADRLKAQKAADRARETQNKKTLDAIAKAERKHAEDQAQMATQAVGIVAGASTQLVSDMISGQEHALERFGLSIMAQAGQALVSYGIQAIGRGVLEASSPLTAPLAPASFAAGAGLVTAGVGLGGVAGGLGSLMGSAGGDGESKRTTRDPGASPRRGTGTSPGGPVVLNLTYGAAGPLPEDTARLISRELRTGAKRAGR